MDSIIETGVDKLIELIKVKKRLSFPEAANELGINQNLLEEWADFLEEEGIITVEYKLTTPYLVVKELRKEEATQKTEDFLRKKETFVNKAESMLSIIEKESKELTTIKSESEKLKKSIGIDITKVEGDLKKLENYENSKSDLHKQIIEKEQEFKKRLHELTNDILNEQKKYETLLKAVKGEEAKLNEEKLDEKSTENKEHELEKRLLEFENIVKYLKKEIQQEGKKILASEKHTKEIKNFAENIRKDVSTKKVQLLSLLSEREKKESRINSLTENIAKKIESTKKELPEMEQASKKFKQFLERKTNISHTIDMLNRESLELRNLLAELIRKGRMLQISPKSKDVLKHIQELQNKYKEIDTKKQSFEGQLKKFMNLIHK